MRMRALAGAVLCGALLLALFAWFTRSQSAPPAALTPALEEVRSGDDSKAASGAPAPVTRSDHGAAPSCAPPEASDEPQAQKRAEEPVFLRGRCIAEESGAPLADCRVQLRIRSAWRAGESWNEERESSLREVQSDREGRFALLCNEHPEMELLLSIHRVDRRTVAGVHRPAEPRVERQESIELGDVALEPAHAVHGVVVDVEDRRVEGAVLELRATTAKLGDWQSVVLYERATSDREGRFVFENGIPAGWQSLYEASALGYELVDPQWLIVPAETRQVVRLRSKRGIRGRVVDDQSAAIPRAEVHADPCLDGRAARTNTDLLGRFALVDPCGRCLDTRIRIAPGACEALALDERFLWGADGVELVAQRSLALEIEVLEAGNGAPIEAYGVALRSTADGGALDRPFDMPTHPAGRCRIENLPRGTYRLAVVPADPLYLPDVPREVQLHDGPTPRIRVELFPAPRVCVRVVNEAGRAVYKAHVSLLRGAPTVDATAVEGSRNAKRLARPTDWGRREIAMVVTDGKGLAVLAAATRITPLGLCITKDGYAPLLLEGLSASTEKEPVRVVLPRGATLTVRVAPASFQEICRSLTLASHHEIATLLVRNDGRYVLDHAPAGRWTLWHDRDSFAEPLGEVDIPSSGSCEVVLDAQRFAPAYLRVRARVGDAPARDGTLDLCRPSRGMWLPYQESECDENGAHARQALLPGRYSLVYSARLGENGRRVRFFLPDHIELAPGEERDLELNFALRRLRLRLIDATGALMPAGTVVHCTSHTNPMDSSLRVDATGCVELDPAPVSPFALQVNTVRVPKEGLLAAPLASDPLERTIVVGK